MLSVLSEVHFWTLKDEIQIPNNDFGAFRYYDKKSSEDSTFFEGKRSYAEKRGQVWMPQNKRPVRLKENLKELEDHLYHQRVVLCQWRDSSLLQLMFTSGLFANVSVNMFTGDPINITFDKFLVGKLLSDYVADVVLTKSHLICSYNDNQLTLIYFAKPALKRNNPKSLSSCDPRISTVDLAGPVGRRLEKRLACNVSGDMVVTWWLCSPNEVYPWSPVVKDQDRANVLIYGISGSRAELLCHHRSEFDLISISFSHIHSNLIHSVEQKVSRNGDVTVENCTFEISRGSMQRTSVTSIALPTHVCCHAFSPAQDKLLLGCIDGSIVLYDDGCGVSVVAKAAFIPSHMSWHPDGGVVMLANERCQLQLLDAALATLRQQLLCEDVTSSTLLDLSSYFRNQPTLSILQWNKKPDALYFAEKYAVEDCLLLLLFERGPFAAINLVGGGGLSKDIHRTKGLSFDSLVAQYLWVNQIERAINLLLTLNWDVYGSVCLLCLQRIVNHLFRQPFTSDREVQLQTALGSFHMPTRPMCPATVEEFKAPVRDMTRRFFHHLLRCKLFEKAFRLAIDLVDCDLFMDIHFSAKQSGEADIAEAAYNKAKDLESSCSVSGNSLSGSSHSLCSRSSCTECSETASAESSEEDLFSSNIVESDERKQRKKPAGRSGSDSVSRQIGVTMSIHPPLPIVNKNLKAKAEDCVLNRLSDSSMQLFSPYLRNYNGGGFSLPDLPQKTQSNWNADYNSSLRQAITQMDRPKVKFSETVTQITLPDRLHTLPEEEEERQPTSTFSASSNDRPLARASSIYSAAKLPHSANSVGIPTSTSVVQNFSNPGKRLHAIHNERSHKENPSEDKLFSLPLQSSGCAGALTGRISTKMHLTKDLSDLRQSPVPSFSFTSSHLENPYRFSKPPIDSYRLENTPCTSKPSVVSFNFGNTPHASTPLVDSFHLGSASNISKTPHSQNVIKEMNEKLKRDLNRNQIRESIISEQVDFLGTEELLTLLPGSRKAVASRTPEALPYNKEIQKSPSANDSYYINYPGVLHDLSEEEENNGSIKIVHFGVV